MINLSADKTYQHRNLLIVLLVYLFGSPFLEAYPSMALSAHFLLSVTLFLAVFAVQRQQRYRSIATYLLIPVLIVYWLGIYDVIVFSRLGGYILLAIYFILLIISFTTQLVRSKGITLNEIFATLCLYLVIGMLWGALYALLEEVSPGSFSGTLLDTVDGSRLSVFNYFSLVTLTTLGYGDISPNTPGAGALCQLEAIVGQFFTAVVVAWLVGNFVSENRKERYQRHNKLPKD